MSSNRLKNIYPNFIRRRWPKRGPIDADIWNSTVDELSGDLSRINNEWNKLVVLASTIPNGSMDSAIDAFINGLDGNNLWVDSTVTSSSSNLTYYNANQGRPDTVKESLDDVYTSINSAIVRLQEEIASNSVSLTSAEESAIGANIFDATQSSSALSLDGKSENNRLNTIQLAKDIYDEASYQLDNDGAANLSYSLKDMISELLDLHSGSWGADPSTINHSAAIIPVPAQAVISNSAVYNDLFLGVAGTLEDDLNYLRTQINIIRGTTAYANPNSELYLGGASDLEALLSATNGTGTKSATNPWGYHIADIEGLAADGASYILTTTVASGLPNHLGQDSIQDVLAWMVDATAKWDGQQFRRLETGLTGPGPFNIYHGRGAYPIVDVIQIDPTVTAVGQYIYTTEHNSLNDFTITYPSGVVLVSGVAISIW